MRSSPLGDAVADTRRRCFSAEGQHRDNIANEPDGMTRAYAGTYEVGPYGPTFDDMTIRLSLPLHFNRMLIAGKLP